MEGADIPAGCHKLIGLPTTGIVVCFSSGTGVFMGGVVIPLAAESPNHLQLFPMTQQRGLHESKFLELM